MYFTHWLLFFKPLRTWFQRKRIPGISKTADIRPYCTIEGTDNVIIGERVIIPPGTLISALPGDSAQIVIEDDVLFGPNVAVYNQTHNFENPDVAISMQGSIAKTVLLKKGCWLGINSVIMPGVTIGQNAVVGSNSVVTKDIPDYAVAVGSPAKVIKRTKE
jgi:acetyltransferase-like isoleucine patch superfamily enzyme